MYGKKQVGTVVATESAAQVVLRRGAAPDLAPEEERLMRMRLGASLPLGTRLERIATATDAEIEVLAYEIEAYLHLKERAVNQARLAPMNAPRPSRTKEKIVRALRRK